MRHIIYRWVLIYIILWLYYTNATIIYAQSFPYDPIIRSPSKYNSKELKKGDNQYMTRQDFESQYKIVPNPSDSLLQPFLYKQNSWPWRVGVFSGFNYAYCGTWENTFGPNKRDKTLYNGTGFNVTGSIDYFLTPAKRRLRFAVGTAFGYQNYITRDVYEDYLHSLAAARTPGVSRDQVTIDQRASEDTYLTAGMVMTFTLTRGHRNPYATTFIEVTARGGLFHTQAATITAFIPSQNTTVPTASMVTGGALIRTVNPSSNLYHPGALGSLALFFPLRNNWNVGIQAQGFISQLNYLIVNGQEEQLYEFKRKHGGFSVGIAIRRSFPHRRLIPIKNDTDTSNTNFSRDVITNNIPPDPIIVSSSLTKNKRRRENMGKSSFMMRQGYDTTHIQTIPNDPNLQPFLYRQNPKSWPWRVGIFGGVNLANCGTWESLSSSSTGNYAQHNGVGINLTGNVDYYLTPDTRQLRFGIGTAFGYQNSNTREGYRNYLYDLAAARTPRVSRDQVTILQGASINTYLTAGLLGTYTFHRKAIAVELGIRGGLFRTEAATISAFIPSQGTVFPMGPLVEGGVLIQRVSPDSKLYHGGGTMSLGVFFPFSKNWQLGVQAQGLSTKLNYLIINGIDDQTTSYKKSYNSFSFGIALRRLLPRRYLVPVAK
ncbi:hypothetical protein [Spirosoma arboris]|uniref:hypothetical protein n=1 Tax=Spirosoma arboris TaxID=2682092 RepID=UPI0018DDA52F|nr:hypothetical protein [Spirosoma arboris]